MANEKPTYYATENGLVNLNKVNQVHFKQPNADGYCQILGFEEFVTHPDTATDLPPHVELGWCLESDIPTFRENIINAAQ